MPSLPFEARSGRPLEVLVKDADGTSWSLVVNVSVVDVTATGAHNGDGTPVFVANLAVNVVTRRADDGAA